MRLIDTEALYKRIPSYVCVPCTFSKEIDKDCKDCVVQRVMNIVDNFPTIDAVEVVRCGECERRYKPLDDDVRNEIYCEFMGSTMRKDDFCSYGCADGERKCGE